MSHDARSILRYELFQVSGHAVTVETVAAAIAVILITLLVSRLVRKGIERLVHWDDPRRMGTIKAILRLIHYVIMLTGLALALDILGISLTALLATGAVFAVGVGFALQNILQNFVSGIILLFEQTIKPNDVLDIDGEIVRVVRMGIRATVARTRDEEDIIIPNYNLVQNPVKNYTMSDSIYRLSCVVGVAYPSDMNQVNEVLFAAARDIPWRLPSRDPLILLTEFGSSSVNFEICVWIQDPWSQRQRRSQLNHAIWDALKNADITIAFPQVDVHLDPPVEESLRLAAGSVPAA